MGKKKRNILDMATILFAENGYNETSIAELARITQSAQGTIFYHFKSKNDLFLAVLSDVKEGIIREFEEYTRTQNFDTGLEMVEEVMGFFFYMAAHHEEWFRLIQRHYPYELARINEECRGHLEAIFTTLIGMFETAIRRGQADGSIKTASSWKTALILFSMVNGLLCLKFHDLYDAGSLYGEFIASCGKLVANASLETRGRAC